MMKYLSYIIVLHLATNVSSFIISENRHQSLVTTTTVVGIDRLLFLQPCSHRSLIFGFKDERSSSVSLNARQRKKNSTAKATFGKEDDVKGPLTLIMVAQFVLFVGVGAVIPSIPLYGKEIGLSGAANGAVISAPAVTLLLLSKSGGKYADMARKPAMIFGMVTIVISDIGTALASGLPLLILARLGLGAGRCISESGERGMLADLAARVPEKRGRILATQQAVAALGIAVGAPLGGVVVELYGPRAAFLCVSFAASVVCIVYFFLPESKTNAVVVVANKVDSDGVVAKRNDRQSLSSSSFDIGEGADWSYLLSKNKWRGLVICQCGVSFGFAAKISSIPLLATETLGGALGSGLLISGCGLSGLVGAPIGGLVTDRFGARTTAVISGIVSSFGLILIPVALGLTLPSSPIIAEALSAVDVGGLGWNSLAFCMAVLVWSTGAAAQGPALTALAQQLAPIGAEATALALPRAAGDGIYIVAPFLLGLLADSLRDISGIECGTAGTAILIGSLSLALLDDRIDEEGLR